MLTAFDILFIIPYKFYIMRAQIKVEEKKNKRMEKYYKRNAARIIIIDGLI
jgi:hypothetical protein